MSEVKIEKDHDVKTIRALYENLTTKIATLASLQHNTNVSMTTLISSLNGTVDVPGWITRTRILEERIVVLEERINSIKEGIIYRFENVETTVKTISKAIEELHCDMSKILDALNR